MTAWPGRRRAYMCKCARARASNASRRANPPSGAHHFEVNGQNAAARSRRLPVRMPAAGMACSGVYVTVGYGK